MLIGLLLSLSACGGDGGGSYHERAIVRTLDKKGFAADSVSCGRLRADKTADCTIDHADGDEVDVLYWEEGNDDYEYSAYDLMTCADLRDQRVRAKFQAAATQSAIADVESEPGYPGEAFVRDGVDTDTDVMCANALNPKYEPWDDIIADIQATVESVGG